MDLVKGKIGIVMLNRPDSLNALNVELFKSLRLIFQKYEEDPNVKVILLKGAGRGYCAGGDIKELSLQTQKHGLSFSRIFFNSEYSLDYYSSTMKKPQIVFWNGIAMGGGVGISIYFKYRIATEKTAFAMPEVGIGLFPDVGGSYFLSRMPWPLGLYLGLSTARLDGADAVSFGVATHFISSEKLPLLEKQLVSLSSVESGTLDKFINSFSSAPPNPSAVRTQWQKISAIFSLDSVEAIFSALEKDNSEWAVTTFKKMKTVSPTSLKVTFQQICRGRDWTVLQTFKQEYQLALNFMKSHDFFEGVRAVLIDKSAKPQWKPAHAEKVTEADVEKYFFANEPEFVPK